jgi:hypothetical protein
LLHREEITGLKTRHYGELRQRRAELAGGEDVDGAETAPLPIEKFKPIE